MGLLLSGPRCPGTRLPLLGELAPAAWKLLNRVQHLLPRTGDQLKQSLVDRWCRQEDNLVLFTTLFFFSYILFNHFFHTLYFDIFPSPKVPNQPTNQQKENKNKWQTSKTKKKKKKGHPPPNPVKQQQKYMKFFLFWPTTAKHGTALECG